MLPRHIVRGGEAIVVEVRMEREIGARGEDIPLDIRYEDADVIVVNKPPGLVVHPGAGNPAGTLQNALLHHDPELAEIPRGGLVHRLDKDTSGLMVVARTLRAHTSLVEQFSERDVHRQYVAIVYGKMVAGGSVDAPIGRHPRDRIKQAVREDGREAITHYRVRERFRALTLIECRLETGRTHQIRVHMAHVRHPLVGDAHTAAACGSRKARAPRSPKRCADSGARRCMPNGSNSRIRPTDARSRSKPRCRPTWQALVEALRLDARENAG